jgi:hypothetical protein
MISEEWAREDLGDKTQAAVFDALTSGGFNQSQEKAKPLIS